MDRMERFSALQVTYLRLSVSTCVLRRRSEASTRTRDVLPDGHRFSVLTKLRKKEMTLFVV